MIPVLTAAFGGSYGPAAITADKGFVIVDAVLIMSGHNLTPLNTATRYISLWANLPLIRKSENLSKYGCPVQ